MPWFGIRDKYCIVDNEKSFAKIIIDYQIYLYRLPTDAALSLRKLWHCTFGLIRVYGTQSGMQNHKVDGFV